LGGPRLSIPYKAGLPRPAISLLLDDGNATGLGWAAPVHPLPSRSRLHKGSPSRSRLHQGSAKCLPTPSFARATPAEH
ncbi:hypothetical protein L7F22_010929, partial [Adiantum nelumboides]|nr:hypothetical protein [Adiantum nelumboides]